jgi:hypothetical protein
MIKLTLEREITPYVWVHPDEERKSPACIGEASDGANVQQS